MIVCLDVDDMLIFSTSLNVINEVDVIFGVKLTKTKHGFTMCQSHYIEKILKRLNCFDVLHVRTPYDPNINLKKNKCESVSQSKYAKIIGSLMFLMNYTRPNIAYVISRLSRILIILVLNIGMPFIVYSNT